MKAIEAQLAQQEDTQISLTDPDARSMQGTGKATGTVGYNVQCAVEIKNHLIVAHEVTNAVNDRSQLLSMAKAALGAETMEAFADRGYYKAEEVLACEGTGILRYVHWAPGHEPAEAAKRMVPRSLARVRFLARPCVARRS